MPLSDEPPDELHRLDRVRYCGPAWVHWTMAIDKRQRGWLTSAHHASLREILIHICARYHLICPSYCLMPDHAHFLWMGLSDSTDQQTAVKFFRRHWAMLLRRSGHALQKQPYDHVLDESERNPDAFEDTMIYIFNNPARAGFVEDWREWKHLGAIAAGYPDLDPRSGGLEDFRESFLESASQGASKAGRMVNLT